MKFKINDDLKKSIKDFRDANCLTQLGLAKLLGCNIRQVQRWEKGDSFPSGVYLLKLLELSKD